MNFVLFNTQQCTQDLEASLHSEMKYLDHTFGFTPSRSWHHSLYKIKPVFFLPDIVNKQKEVVELVQRSYRQLMLTCSFD